jgi:phosphate-selective porin OprO/OprP
VACRWSYLDFTDVRGQQLTDVTLGVNWYWNPHTRMTFNWIHPFAKNSPVATTADAQGDVFGMRLGVDF